jgi:hypothetical protein
VGSATASVKIDHHYRVNRGTDLSEQNAFPERVRLENKVRDYARAGWSVVEQTGIKAKLTKGEQTVVLSLDQEGQVVVNGPVLPDFYIDGRMRAWIYLLVMLIVGFTAAWLLGVFS